MSGRQCEYGATVGKYQPCRSITRVARVRITMRQGCISSRFDSIGNTPYGVHRPLIEVLISRAGHFLLLLDAELIATYALIILQVRTL